MPLENTVAMPLPPGLVISKLFTCENSKSLYSGCGKVQATEQGRLLDEPEGTHVALCASH